jgi:FAD/FMN-containing dehydrogenase
MATRLVEFEDLAKRFNGRLVLPTDSAYEPERQLWNAMFDRRPLAIAQCTGSVDVINALAFGRQQDLPISVRAGGHDAGGKSVVDEGLVIDVGPMNGVLVDPSRRRVIVQAGARWRAVDRETQLHGLAVTGGTVSDTGVAGLTLGGGIGFLMRRCGVTVDSLLSIDAVSVDGKLIRSSPREESELFWGMRGAGANFGIATSFEFALHSVGPTILAGMVFYGMREARRVLRGWRDCMEEASENVASSALLMRAPTGSAIPAELRGELVVGMVIAYIGEDQNLAEPALKPLRTLGHPIADYVRPMPYVELQQLLERQRAWPERAYEKGGYLAATMRDAFIEDAIAGLDTAPGSSKGRGGVPLVALMRMGGAIDQVPDGAMAFSRKNAAYWWNVAARWENADDDTSYIEWCRAVYAKLHPYSSPEAYINLTVSDDVAWLRNAYGAEKYERLVALKNTWDPTNVLRNNKNIPPSSRPLARIVARA